MYEETGPATRAMIGYNLSDAQEHLEELLKEMQDDAEFGEIEFGIGLAHIYAHLNRAWHQRNTSEEELDNPTAAQWEKWSQFPTDLKPLA